MGYAVRVELTKQAREDLLKVIGELARACDLKYSRHVAGRAEAGQFSVEDLLASLERPLRLLKAETDGEALDGKKHSIVGYGRTGILYWTCGKFVLVDGRRVYRVISARRHTVRGEGSNNHND